MKRRTIIWIVTILLAVVMGITVFVVVRQLSVSEPMSFAEARQQAKEQEMLPGCLELHSQHAPAKTREAITKAVGAQLIDVPAGVAHAVFFNMQNDHKAAGTILYDGGGSIAYNFTLEQIDARWEVRAFDACDPLRNSSDK
jgi:hypothetical protein